MFDWPNNGLTQFSAAGWHVLSCPNGLPLLYEDYCKHAAFAEEINLDMDPSESDCLFVAAGPQSSGWPSLVVAQRFKPVWAVGPGILLVPESQTLFIGAGERLLAYDLQRLKRMWEDYTEFGFWRWQQHDQSVVMSAELELAAWTLKGEKLWAMFVEPPWDYTVRDGIVHLDVMGQASQFPLLTGPPGYSAK